MLLVLLSDIYLDLVELTRIPATPLLGTSSFGLADLKPPVPCHTHLSSGQWECVDRPFELMGD